jgi:hypothetical protein
LQVDAVAVMTGRMTRFPGMVVMAERRGPGGGNGRVDSAVPEHGGGVVPGATVKAEEEQDGDDDGGGGAGQLGSRARQ